MIEIERGLFRVLNIKWDMMDKRYLIGQNVGIYYLLEEIITHNYQ
jgi:hypothetical protein